MKKRKQLISVRSNNQTFLGILMHHLLIMIKKNFQFTTFFTYPDDLLVQIHSWPGKPF